MSRSRAVSLLSSHPPVICRRARLLVFRGEGDVERQGAGYARVKAFREGVINGAQPCLDYHA